MSTDTPLSGEKIAETHEEITPLGDAQEFAVIKSDRSLYINRELSWLAFNRRVLEEAQDEHHPLLERVKFLAIFGSNLDEFFMIRIPGLQAQRTAGVADVALDGLTPTEALEQIAITVNGVLTEAEECRKNILAQLRREHIEICHFADLSPDEKAYLATYFQDEIFPILTPLAVDPGHPFPHISNLSLNLAVIVRDPGIGERFARMKLPGTIPRFVPLPRHLTPPPTPKRGDNGSNGNAAVIPADVPGLEVQRGSVGEIRLRFVYIEDVIAHFSGSLFPGLQPVAAYPFRVTRNADFEIQEDEAEDLLRTIEEGIRERHFGFVTRLEVTSAMPQRVRESVVEGLEMDPRNIVTLPSEAMALSALMELTKVDRPDLKFPPHVPRTPPAFRTGDDPFTLVGQRDILLHHPYESFAPVTALIEAAAHDPHVRAIKQTLYRLGPNSPLTPALIEARDADTQVAVLVELKARFDEENNITWARQLEAAGVHVVYGLVGLKTHCKVLLIVRKEPGGAIRRYCHFGTGNYNATTARFYTDFGLLTADPQLAADATDLFNYLTGYSRQKVFRKILVAPVNLRERFAAMIERETRNAIEGRPARILFQMNSLADPHMVELLYRASQAGVKVDLIVRGVCCLRPGVPGVSENVTVTSVVGQFLEHSRCYYFENAGDPILYLGSADLMTRNLDRRVEVMFPVEKPELRDYVVKYVLETILADNTQSRRLQSDGTWERVKPEPRKKRVDAQAIFIKGVQAIGAKNRKGR
ncbi:MAG: polyphosphate kinase 1 [Akkermansiaceae bacterium]|nr:polyphosphate kinase 1 [Armatimonadota bacterium]